jgi:molybdate/tungstate transport system ATP-binding protein
MIRIHDLSVRLPGFSLKKVSLSIQQGEFFCLMGPTGSGKTLVLESIAGITSISGGTIIIGGRDVTSLPPNQRGIGIVYQDCALFPHLNVKQNIYYGLRYHGGLSTTSAKRCDDIIRQLNLSRILHRSVIALSGGEKQRVALARALATAPKVLLLDEPLAALDPCFREEIRDLFKRLHSDTGLTVLMVTHDFTDAHSLAHRVAVLRNGKIEQTDTIPILFKRPATKAVAEFVGIKNVLPVRIENHLLRIGDMVFPYEGKNGKKHYAAIRPERIHVQAEQTGRQMKTGYWGNLVSAANKGLTTELTIDVSATRLKAVLLTRSFSKMEIQPGSSVIVSIDPHDIHLV